VPTTQLVFLILSVGSRGGPEGLRSTGGSVLFVVFVGGIAEESDGSGDNPGDAAAEEGGEAGALDGSALAQAPPPATRAVMAAQNASLRVIGTSCEGESIGRAAGAPGSPPEIGNGARGADSPGAATC
jgi:hypothetical protein